MEALEDTAEFLQVCSNFFQSAHSIKIKHAYAEVFVELLDPIAAVIIIIINTIKLNHLMLSNRILTVLFKLK